MTNEVTQIVLAKRPQGNVKLTDFRIEKTKIGKVLENQILVQVTFFRLILICEDR